MTYKRSLLPVRRSVTVAIGVLLVGAAPGLAGWYYGSPPTYIDTPAWSETTTGPGATYWASGRFYNKNNHTNKVFYRFRDPGILAHWDSWTQGSQQYWTIYFSNLNVQSITWGQNYTGGLARLAAGQFS